MCGLSQGCLGEMERVRDKQESTAQRLGKIWYMYPMAKWVQLEEVNSFYIDTDPRPNTNIK